LTTRGGAVHPVTVETGGSVVILTVGELPVSEASPCFQLRIILEAVEQRNGRPVALDGRLSGRCPNTLIQTIHLTR
jgi:hypothetical protein